MGKAEADSWAIPLTDGQYRSTKHDGDNDGNLKEYDLENYDDESDREPTVDDKARTSIFGNIKALAYHDDNEDDPYITLQDNGKGDLSDEDEREELEILPTDNLVLAARVQDETAHLECYVYEDDADNLYVHHDIMLPAVPLCLEWLDIPVSQEGANTEDRGNFVAIGTMDPDIELWDLDAVDRMFPNAILGTGGEQVPDQQPKKSKRKSRKKNNEYHVDAVLSLSANRQHRNLLASASADETIKLWDLSSAKCAKSYTYHSDKVCSIDWNPKEATAMLSGSYDKTIVAADMRAPDAGTRRWCVESDIEKVAWDPHNSNPFFVSTESGLLHYFDARKPSSADKTASPVWRLQAHSAALTTFSVNPHIDGFVATGSDDKTVKLWKVPRDSSTESRGPTLIASREFDTGRLFSVNFAPDEVVAYRLAVAGSKGTLKIWDTSTNNAVRGTFEGGKGFGKTGAGDGITSAKESTNVKDRVIGLGDGVSDDDGSDDSEDEGDDDDDDASDQDEEMLDGEGTS